MAFLSIKKLNQKFYNKKILQDITIDIETGEITALLGPNGAGKTTLLKTIIGLLPNPKNSPDQDIILFNQNIINNWATSKRVDSGILYLPQNPSLFGNLTVIQNLKLVYEYHNYWKNKNHNEFMFQLDAWLEQINLTEHKYLLARNLSGGQKRKLEVARAILMHPQIILLDEPFAGVDPKSIYELKKIFVDLAQNNIAVLISDHNVDQLLSIAKKVYVVINGQIVTCGGVKDIINNNYTQETYFGKQFYNELSEKFL